MTKVFEFDCDFGGQKSKFKFYIGEPEQGHHPLHFQADWLSKERGGTVPAEVMDAISKLHELSKKNNVSLEDLAVYALGSAQEVQNTPSETMEGEEDLEEEDK
ncbi:DUF2610 domain-containing protein [Rickettsia endosymbiont of Halotydeus destructor]|uniref:DUF2610 domain-containing protein n=1 Tax=Rickettsia endosymbiont of Halotydeus destructor TaxID=2996754 RepID=UPI003BAF6DDD